jgi:ABC-type dipeptide/oligopeptide/nickel transport system ATPase component
LVELGTAAEIFTAPKHPTTVRFVKTATENDVSDKILSELVIRHPNLAPEIDDLFKEVHNV